MTARFSGTNSSSSTASSLAFSAATRLSSIVAAATAMPPSPAYNAFAVLYSVARILELAARHRAAAGARALGVNDLPFTTTPGPSSAPTTTLAPTDTQTDGEPLTGPSIPRISKAEQYRIQRKIEDEEFNAILGKYWVNGKLVDTSFGLARHEKADEGVRPDPEILKKVVREEEAGRKEPPLATAVEPQQLAMQALSATSMIANAPDNIARPLITEELPTPVTTVIQEIVKPIESSSVPPGTYPPPPPVKALQASKVPSSRIGRLFHYGGLAATLSYGAASEILRRSTSSAESGPDGNGSLMLTESNIKRLVGKLTQMRGAALKLGQFMSIQDTHLLPPELDEIFRRVQDGAHYMPDWQMENVLSASYGPNWCNPELSEETIFTEFERVPFAAASIGQVHRARLAPRFCPPELRDEAGAGLDVAVKVQFPNIVNSIRSDLGYVKMLLSVGGLLPKGLFLDRSIEVLSSELADECSYIREASFLKKFRSEELLGSDRRFKVPWVWEGSTDEVLVMERVGGISVGAVSSGKALDEEAEDELPSEVVKSLNQQDRNDIAARIIELCLKELFEFRTMQTDPNWTNFLWNGQTRQVELVDFGATRSYSKKFMDMWLRLLEAAASDDKEKCIQESIKLGYLTGEEDEIMLNAHVRSLTLLATPFKAGTAQPFGFGPGSQWAEVTKEIRSFIPVMVTRRLTPPPRETYSLNRKLSGAFLLAARLDARVDTKAIWDKVVGKYEFDTDEGKETAELEKDVD